MSRARCTAGCAVLAAWLALAGTVLAAPPRSSSALLEGLRRSGRAEASVEFVASDPIGGALKPSRGVLALEPPDRARLDFPATGEAVTLRVDGGEWLQPAAKQLLRLSPEHAAAALRWWRILLDPERASVRERRLGPGRYRLRIDGPTEADSDSAEVVLDARGLPAELVLGEAGSATRARLSRWRFLSPRGAPAFRLTAPAGYADVELP